LQTTDSFAKCGTPFSALPTREVEGADTRPIQAVVARSLAANFCRHPGATDAEANEWRPGGATSLKRKLSMISVARANYQRISPRKARIIIDLVRGRDAAEALQILEFTPKAGAPFVKKLIASAVANAKIKRPDVDLDALFISKASVDKGPNSHMRRWRPRAMGRATQVTKGISHLCIELDQR
jgi:large subunit ribosomal protein L22